MFLKIISEDIVDRGAGLKAGIMTGNWPISPSGYSARE